MTTGTSTPADLQPYRSPAGPATLRSRLKAGGTVTLSTIENAYRDLVAGPACPNSDLVEEWDFSHERPQELDDPPVCDFGPPFFKGELT